MNYYWLILIPILSLLWWWICREPKKKDPMAPGIKRYIESISDCKSKWE